MYKSSCAYFISISTHWPSGLLFTDYNQPVYTRSYHLVFLIYEFPYRNYCYTLLNNKSKSRAVRIVNITTTSKLITREVKNALSGWSGLFTKRREVLFVLNRSVQCPIGVASVSLSVWMFPSYEVTVKRVFRATQRSTDVRLNQDSLISTALLMHSYILPNFCWSCLICSLLQPIRLVT